MVRRKRLRFRLPETNLLLCPRQLDSATQTLTVLPVITTHFFHFSSLRYFHVTYSLEYRPLVSCLYFNLFGVNTRGRSRPFDIRSFFESQVSSIRMAVDGEKERVSGEITREGPGSPILPTVNPAAEKSEPPKAAFHPSVYVM